ncbi:sulfatase family protein [Haloferula rosea]|uniref:Arylsulfatase n=1 Tax=Haloferula rosea TaxID=490093 RepID=A0A934VEI0_9BACT|nr:arylsulfatase [Haloferula rosea]MBK1825545.1 arylsulfatase [Haloferula rosea]
MKNRLILLLFVSLVTLRAAPKPNIIYIFADDMGYGDVQCLNPERGKIPTPHMDRLAAEGMIFTDAHSSSSVCTPTRYGVLTGRYNWRTHLQKGVLWGYSEPLIDADRLTVPALLKQQGYKTAMVGKWHLGMNLPVLEGKPIMDGPPDSRKPKRTHIDWKGEIKDGPVDRGFDYLYGISASLDMAPYIWIENDRFVGTADNSQPTKPAPGFKKDQVLPEIGRKTVEYIEKQDGSKPFFIYVPLTSPHTPIVPTEEWKGKSGLGSYGDFQMQTDHVIGEIMKAVDASDFADNTLVIVTADNGCSKAARIDRLEAQGHFPSAHLRGSKADLWDGGHRVPFIVRWPKVVKAGSTSDQTIGLTDLMATCAELSGATLPDNAGEDSISFAPALKGETIESTRKGVIHHSISGHFAYRQGKWKLLLAKGSGGWTSPTEKQVKKGAPVAQLYDLEADPGETKNLYESHPEVAERLLKQLESDVSRGRSTDGAAAKNDVAEIELWKSGK